MNSQSIETGNLQLCISRTIGHADSTKFVPPLTETNQRMRVEVIERSLQIIADQVRKIREAAGEQENSEILAILDEMLDFPKPVLR